MNRLTNGVADRVPLFRDKVDKERVSLSLRSKPFTTLSALRAANRQLVGELKEGQSTDADVRQAEDLAVEFWDFVTDMVKPWAAVADGSLDPSEARQDYISSYALILWAVAAAGRTAMQIHDDWKPAVKKLANVDWLKLNPEWQGICMAGDEIVTRQPTRKAAADLLRWKMDLGQAPDPVLEVDEV